jgi:hypothetical protein
MAFDVVSTEAFDIWFGSLSVPTQQAVLFGVELLKAKGAMLGRPHVDTLKGSRYPNMKELRVRHAGHHLRILFAFDPERKAVLLVGGDKTSVGNRIYERLIHTADALYEAHLKNLQSTKKVSEENHGKESR